MAYLHGVSTRKVEDEVTSPSGSTRASASPVSPGRADFAYPASRHADRLIKSEGQALQYRAHLMSPARRGTVGGIAAMLVFLLHYYYLLLNPVISSRALIERYNKIDAGIDLAPDQYRLLVPKAASAATGITSLPLHVVVIGIDSMSLLGGAMLLAWLLKRRRLESQILPTLLYIAAFATTTLLHPRPETLPAFLGATCVLTAYVVPGRWTAVLGGAGAFLLAGCRPEMAAAASIPFMMRWREERRARYAAASVGLIALAAAGLAIPLFLFPHTPYLTSLIQIGYNLNPFYLVVPFLALAPVVAYLTRPALRRWAPLLAWVGSVLALVFVVGRVDEARIYFPLSGILGFVAANLWARSQEVEKLARTRAEDEVA